MTRRFVRRFRSMSFAALIATIMILAGLTSLAQVRDAGQPLVNNSAAPQLSAGQRATIPSEPANVPSTVVHRPHGKTKHSAARAQENSLFQPAVVYPSGGYASSSVAVADFNGDGKPDLAVLNDCAAPNQCSTGTVGILLGNGDGTFQPAVLINVGQQIAEFGGLAVADVNGDGRPDLIVAACCESNGDGAIAVLLGNGDGTFRMPVLYDSGGRTGAPIAVADVNGDGKPDILAINWNDSDDSTVGVLLGNGDGTFQSALTSAAPDDPGCLTVADANNDGKPDVLICSEASVAVLLGNGNGTFQPFTNTNYATGFCTNSVAVGDFNGDGFPDMVAPNEGPDGCNAEGFAGVFLGDGNGDFQNQVSYAFSDNTYSWMSVAVTDVNGDGNLDIVATTGLYPPGMAAVLLGNGDGTFQAPALFSTGGSGAISVAAADLNGDGRPDLVVANFDSGTVGVLLNGAGSPSPTTTALVSSLNPSTYGQAVTFTAAVSSSSGTPIGTVIFYDSSTSIGSVTLTSGTAMLATSSLAVGSHSITAAYQGSGSFAPSTSPVLVQVVNGTTIATTTTLTTSKNPGIYQQPVTFTATVTSASGTPTGTVVFLEDGHALSSATLVNGSASFTTSSLKRGKYAMTASYMGSGNFLPSTSPVLEEWINLSGLFQSHIVLRGSGSPSLVGQPVTFTAYVSSKYGQIPNGDLVDFSTGDGGGLGTGTIQNGQASITTSSLRAGVLTIFAYYEGDDDFHSSYTEQKQTVDKDPTTTTVSATPNPAVYGQAITYTVTVTSNYGTPTGSVRISDMGLVALVNGVATITKNLVRAGTHDITASYQSDSHFARSTSLVYKEVVTPASTTTALTSSANPSSLGQTVTFTATVTSSAGVNPFGTVTFAGGGATLGTATLKDGVASVSTASLPEGSTLITATYNGADSFTGSSASLTQVVQ